MTDAANIIVRRHKAYIPSFGTIPDGLNMVIEPIHIVDLELGAIVAAIEKVIAAGTPRIPTPSREEIQHRQNLLPKVAGVRSWKELARSGHSHLILWEPHQTRLVPSKHDKQGRWVDDYAKAKVFPKDTSLIQIVTALLEDARSRPELGLADL